MLYRKLSCKRFGVSIGSAETRGCSTWLYRIAKNNVFMHLRRCKTRVTEVSFDEGVADEQESGRTATYTAFSNPAANAITRISLERAISSLAKGYRSMVILHDVHGFEHGEIARMLGCSVGTTKSQLHKARLKLRRELSDCVYRIP
jgi:RNA polymerase sigma-70 factor, ECF subfamily